MGSNLPPGVTPADIDRHFGGGHEHVFEEPDSEVFDDGAFILTYGCDHVMPPRARYNHTCDTERHVRLDASMLEFKTRVDGRWVPGAASDDNIFHDAHTDEAEFPFDIPTDIEAEVSDAICDDDATVSRYRSDGVTVDADYHERVVYIDGTHFTTLPDRQIRITYDNVSEDIRQ